MIHYMNSLPEFLPVVNSHFLERGECGRALIGMKLRVPDRRWRFLSSKIG